MIRYSSSILQELQEGVNCMNDSQDFQDLESICSGKLSHVLSQPAVVQRPRSMLNRDRSLKPETWNLTTADVEALQRCIRFLLKYP